MENIHQSRQSICKALKIINGAGIIIWFGMFYLTVNKLHEFSYDHYFLYDKIAWFIFCYINWISSRGFVRYMYCAISAFMALRVYYGFVDEYDSELAREDNVIYPLYAMLIIVGFGILTTAAEWKHKKRRLT